MLRNKSEIFDINRSFLNCYNILYITLFLIKRQELYSTKRDREGGKGSNASNGSGRSLHYSFPLGESLNSKSPIVWEMRSN